MLGDEDVLSENEELRRGESSVGMFPLFGALSCFMDEFNW